MVIISGNWWTGNTGSFGLKTFVINNLFLEEKGNNTGLYCSDCGTWIKWVSKDEKRAFEHSKKTNSESDDELVEYVSSYDTDSSYAILELLPDHMTRAEVVRIVTTYGMQEDVSNEEFKLINNFAKKLIEREDR